MVAVKNAKKAKKGLFAWLMEGLVYAFKVEARAPSGVDDNSEDYSESAVWLGRALDMEMRVENKVRKQMLAIQQSFDNAIVEQDKRTARLLEHRLNESEQRLNKAIAAQEKRVAQLLDDRMSTMTADIVKALRSGTS